MPVSAHRGWRYLFAEVRLHSVDLMHDFFFWGGCTDKNENLLWSGVRHIHVHSPLAGAVILSLQQIVLACRATGDQIVLKGQFWFHFLRILRRFHHERADSAVDVYALRFEARQALPKAWPGFDPERAGQGPWVSTCCGRIGRRSRGLL